jgi:hypothetical protein
MNAEDAPGTHEWGARAIALAERLGDADCLADAMNSVGTADFLLYGPERRELVEQSIEIAFDAALETHVLRGYSNMAWAAARHRSHALAERYLQAGLARCREPDFDLWRLHLLGYRASLRLEQGRWHDAVESAMLAVRDPRSSPLPRILGRTVIGLVRARRGDPEVWPVLDEAAELATPNGELQRIAPVAAARAEAAWLAGNWSAVGPATDTPLEVAGRCQASWVVGQLALWRQRAGIVESVPDAVPEPYALELAGRADEAAEGLARTRLPLRGCARARGRSESGRSAARTRRASGARCAAGREDRRPAAPRARRTRSSSRPTAVDASEPARAD